MQQNHLDSLLMRQLPAGVILSDSSTRVLYANPAAADLLKLPIGTLNGMHLYSRVHPRDQAKVCLYAAQLKEKKTMVTKRRFKRGDGMYVFIERYTCLLDDGTQLSVCRDVTARERANRRHDLFVSIASHELRDPIMLIKLHAEQLRRESEERTLTRQNAISLLDGINEQVDREARIIGDFLDVSRIRKGKLVFRMQQVDIRALVEKTVDVAQQMLGRHISFTPDGPGSYFVLGDRDRLTQVVMNLLSNAEKFSPKPAPIDVSLFADRNSIEIAVRDYGYGIRSEDRKSIFKKYFQAEKTPSSGLGLGLFLSTEIIKRHSGHLLVSEPDGRGSIFTVVLPHANSTE